MDCVKLINLVQERKSLWDPQDSQYHNRAVNRSLWCEVASSLNSTSSLVKLKWQRLRDTHRREVRKSYLPTVSHVQGDSTWRYFSQMSFLEDTYTIRATVGYSHNREYFSDIVDTQRDSESDAIDVEFDETKALYETDKDLYDRDYHMNRLMDRSGKDRYDEMVQIEKAKLVHLQQLRKDKRDMQDDDHCFLMSLLPFLRAIPKRRKLQLRSRMLQIMIEETENAESNLNSSSLQ